MPKNLNLTDNLEQYIINHSDDLTEIQKEIINYNKSLGDQKKLQISTFFVPYLVFPQEQLWLCFLNEKLN